jgi:hypothetical protein
MDAGRGDFEPVVAESVGGEEESVSVEAAPASGKQERRIYPRSQCWGTTWINLLPEGIKTLGYLINLGLGGCHIDTDAPLPARVGDRVEVLLYLDGFTLRLAGVVIHMEENNARVGIAFTAVSPRKAGQIRHVMEVIDAAEQKRLAGVEELGG